MAKFARAWESADLDALVALLTDDVFIAMPPVPFGYEGRDAVTRYCASLFAAGRRFNLVPVRANGQPAFGAYLRSPAGIRHATAFYVLSLAGGQICAMTRFEASVLPWFGCAITPEPVAGLSSSESEQPRKYAVADRPLRFSGMRQSRHEAGTSAGLDFDPAESRRAPGRFWPKPALRHAPEWTAASPSETVIPWLWTHTCRTCP